MSILDQRKLLCRSQNQTTLTTKDAVSLLVEASSDYVPDWEKLATNPMQYLSMKMKAFSLISHWGGRMWAGKTRTFSPQNADRFTTNILVPRDSLTNMLRMSGSGGIWFSPRSGQSLKILVSYGSQEAWQRYKQATISTRTRLVWFIQEKVLGLGFPRTPWQQPSKPSPLEFRSTRLRPKEWIQICCLRFPLPLWELDVMMSKTTSISNQNSQTPR